MFSFFGKKTPEPAVSSLEDNTHSPNDVNGLSKATQTSLEKGGTSATSGSTGTVGTLSTLKALESDTHLDPPIKARALWLTKLKEGLKRTGQGFKVALNLTTIDEHLYEELEGALLSADTGFAATQYVLNALKEKIRLTGLTNPQQVKALLIDILASLLKPLEKELILGEHKTTVIMVAGVNGAGKTTSIGKITRHLSDSGLSVLLAAADTFRAAAREQLLTWADRNKVEIISQESADPAAVSFDAVSAGKARGRDVVLIDTAGRLSTQTHLMEELKKIKRVIQKADETAPHEVLLVIDGNTGQNALTQVKAFDEAVGLTGLVVTKLDGTAKGGVLAAIALWNTERLKAQRSVVPVYFIGVGEKLEDLQRFNAAEFAQALIGE